MSIFLAIDIRKSVRFRSLQFDTLRSSTTLTIQIYTRKTHAINVSVHKPYLNCQWTFWSVILNEVVEVSKYQAFRLITLFLAHACALCLILIYFSPLFYAVGSAFSFFPSRRSDDSHLKTFTTAKVLLFSDICKFICKIRSKNSSFDSFLPLSPPGFHLLPTDAQWMLKGCSMVA